MYQDLALADNLDVVANMFLGREQIASRVVLDELAMEHKAQEVLESLSVTTLQSVRQTVAGLSGGQRQAVAVAKAVMWGKSRMVILDEPTAALGVAQTRQVLDLVRRLAAQGFAVVIISHNLHDIFEVCRSHHRPATGPAGGGVRHGTTRPSKRWSKPSPPVSSPTYPAWTKGPHMSDETEVEDGTGAAATVDADRRASTPQPKPSASTSSVARRR